METQHRDQWEMDDDLPSLWRVAIDDRARAQGHTISRDARWMLFALQDALKEIDDFKSAQHVRFIAIYGPLANGVESEHLSLALVVKAYTPPMQRAAVWEAFAEHFAQVELKYAVSIDCLMLDEETIARPTSSSPIWATIERDSVLVWPDSMDYR